MTLCACVKGGASGSRVGDAAGEGDGSCSALFLPPRVQRVVAPLSTSTVSSEPVSLKAEMIKKIKSKTPKRL